MSTTTTIPLEARGIDPYASMLEIADVSGRQAQTSLLEQQARGAAIQNYLSGLRVNAIAPALSAMAGGGVTPPAAAAAGVGPPSAPAAAAPAAGLGGAPAAPPVASPYGAVMSPFGVAVPGMLAVSALTSADPAKAWESAVQTRARTLYQLLTPVAPNDVGAWNGAVAQAYSGGWITPDDYAALYNHPEHRAQLLNSFADPDQYLETQRALATRGMTVGPSGMPVPYAPAIAASGAQAGAEEAGRQAAALPYAGPRAGAVAAAQAPYEPPTQVTVPDPDNPGQFRTDTILRSAQPGYFAATPGARPMNGADLVNPTVTLTPSAYSARVTQRENPGGVPGAANALSSAVGNGQFTDQTRLNTVTLAKPAWAQGMTRQQILDQRAVPQHAAEMSYALAQQNAPKLQEFGLPVNTLTLGLAHQFGADGAARLMAAAPATPVRSLFSPDIFASNPGLAPMTAGQVMAQAFQSYGVNQVDLTRPFTTAGPPTRVAPGSAPGLPKLTPTGEAALAVTRSSIEADRKDVDASLDAGQRAQLAQADLDLARSQLSVLLAQMNEGRASLRQVEEARFNEDEKWIAFYDAQFSSERARLNLLRQTGELMAALK